MDKNYTIFVGTIGNSLRCSRDGGETWKGAPSDQPLPDSGVGGLEGNVRALAVYPDNPHRILAGSDRMGIYRSDDNGESWRLLKSPMEGMEIWSIDVDPVNSDNIYVGTRPKGFRSQRRRAVLGEDGYQRRRGCPGVAAQDHQDHRRSP